MSRFNLIDEPWIPVRYQGGHLGELGIRDTLLRSKEITVIEDPSPLVVAALHRFLLAVLYRALAGPTDIDQAKELFRSGIPSEAIEAYLAKWRERFWLFDESYPFGQNPGTPPDKIEPWTKLTAEHNATSNKVLFDHTDTRAPGAHEPSECARWLLSTMTFSISGGRGYYPSPSANAMMCIPIGGTFCETLLFNLVPYANPAVMKDDSALWERKPPALPLDQPRRTASGYADLYSWPSRMLYLEQLPSGLVSSVRFVPGSGFDNPNRTPDPFVPYRLDKVLGNLPLQFREDRGPWRDFDSLLPDNSGLAPLTVQHALRMARHGVTKLPEAVLVLGLRYEPPRGNVELWRMERFQLPGAMSGDRDIRAEIRALLAEAESFQKALWTACRSFARDLLSRGEREPAKDDIRRVVAQMPVIACYWSELESRFHDLIGEYGTERDSEDIRWRWLKSVRGALKGAWEQHRRAVAMGDAWAIRALVKAETYVERALMELDAEISRLEPQEEGA